MKAAKFPLLQILFISLLICSFTKATDTLNKNQKTLRDLSLGNAKGLSIPFEPIYQPDAPDNSQLGFLLKFPGENLTVPVIINMKSNGIWINNSTKPSWILNFNCSASQTCKNKGQSEHAWIERLPHVRSTFMVAGTLVKEQVIFEGGFTLPSTDILIANSGDDLHSRYYLQSFSGVFGLSFRRSCSDAPIFYDFLKEEGLIEKSIFSIYLDASNHGELLFGGYDPKRAGSEFHYVKLEYVHEAPGFYLPTIKSVGYGNELEPAVSFVLIIDFDSEDFIIPDWIVSENDFVDSKGACVMPPNLKDIVLRFEEMTLRIPPAVYTNLTSFKQPKDPNGQIPTDVKCTFLKGMDWQSPGGMPRVVLGRQFLKHFYTVFDLQNKTVGFSTMSGFIPKSPVFGKAEVSYPWFSNQQTDILVALFLIAFALIIFVILWCLIKKALDWYVAPSTELVPTNIERTGAQYSVVNENEEDSQQEGPEEVA